MNSRPTSRRLSAFLIGALAISACEDGRSFASLTPLAPREGPLANVSPTGGPYLIDGVEYYEYEGELYPLEGTPARILSAQTTGDVWPYGGFVSARMEFQGHDGTQTTTWSLTKLDGTPIAGNTQHNFGVKSGTIFSRTRKMEGTLPLNHQHECDLRLKASTNHEAWFIGFAIKGVGVGGSGDVPVTVTIEFKPGERSLAFSMMGDRERPCDEATAPEDPTGSGGGGDDCGDYGCGDDSQTDTWCNVCIEWDYYYDLNDPVYLYTETECWTETMSCDEYLS